VSIPDEQQETAAFLRGLAGQDPAETHISAVFIGSDTVWKLKKAVRLSFLDFTAVEARHRYLLRELEVNREAAPGLYHDVVPVVRRPDGALTLGDARAFGDARALADARQPGGDAREAEPEAPEAEAAEAQAPESAPVDWVLRMAPVPAADFLDAIAARQELTPVLLDALADTVAGYHRGLPPVAGTDAVAAMRHVARGNASAARDAGLPAARIEAWLHGELAAIEQIAPWLAARAAGGFVRRAHGDLHLGNLCLWQGTPVPFDAIEFDEAMATIDLGYDLAFLLMDLDHRVAPGAANRVLNRYVARTGDAALTGGLPVFLSMRAMIRAQVESSRGNRDAGVAYLDRAFAYLAPAAAVVVAIGGLPGTGKSTLARALSPSLGAAPGALVLRSDEIRKRQHGVAPEQRLPESAYGPAASDAVFAELAASVAVVAGGGHAVIADAMFLRPAQRAAVEQAAAGAGVPFLGLWLTAPRDRLEARLASRTGDASDATVAVLDAMARHDRGGGDWVTIETGDDGAGDGATGDGDGGDGATGDDGAGVGMKALSQTRQAMQTRFGSHIQQEAC
jgi:aminoglycoside phosphotransferase family enzyme/predicted kinase